MLMLERCRSEGRRRAGSPTHLQAARRGWLWRSTSCGHDDLSTSIAQAEDESAFVDVPLGLAIRRAGGQ
jgi:hypothetical protein